MSHFTVEFGHKPVWPTGQHVTYSRVVNTVAIRACHRAEELTLRRSCPVGPTERRAKAETHRSPVPPLQSPSVPGAPFGRP